MCSITSKDFDQLSKMLKLVKKPIEAQMIANAFLNGLKRKVKEAGK